LKNMIGNVWHVSTNKETNKYLVTLGTMVAKITTGRSISMVIRISSVMYVILLTKATMVTSVTKVFMNICRSSCKVSVIFALF